MKLETFFKKFDLFANASDAVPRMRELLLQLAVQGKLVEQIRSERSAMECIRKANRPLVDIALDGPIQTHEGWVALPLGCVVASNTGGGTPSKSNPDYWNGSIPWASVKDIQSDKYLTTTIDTISQKGLENSSSKLIPPGRLLVVTRMGLGKLAINQVPVAINQDLRAIEPTQALDLDYAYLLFKSLKIVGSGMTVKGITVERLHAMPVLIPPLAEQKRIVAKVEDLMALCDRLEAQQQEREKRQAALARASLSRFAAAPTPENLNLIFHPSYHVSPSDLRKAILTLAVQGKLVPQDPNDEPASDLISQIAEEKRHLVVAKIIREKDEAAQITKDELPFVVPEGWEWTRLSSITRRIHYGYTASAKSEIKDVRLLRITDIQNNSVDWQSVPGCEIAKDEVAQYQLERSDILVARTGGTVGKTYLVQDVPVVAVFASYLIRIQGGTALFDRYLKLFLESPTYWVQLEKGARGAAQPNVNGQTLGRMVVSVPPLAEQHRIVAKVEQLMASVDALEAQLATARATATNLLAAAVAELTGTPANGKVSAPAAPRAGRRGRPRKS